jgi:hypothetical protein
MRIVERCFWDLSLAPLGCRCQARYPQRRYEPSRRAMGP